MSAVQIQQADAHLADAPKLEYVTVGAEQRAKATFVVISNTVRGSGAQRKERTTSIRWVAWGPAAEAHAQHLARGAHVNVSGRMTSFRYEEPDSGRVIYGYDFVADRNGAATVPGVGYDSDGRFSAVRLDATAFGEYRVNEVFGINATVRGLSNISDVRLGNSTGTDGGRGQPIAWTRLEAFIGVRAAW